MKAIKKSRILNLLVAGLLASALALPQMASAAPSMERSGGGKNWSFKVGFSAIRDDNLLGAPERGAIPVSLVGQNFDDTGIRWTTNVAYNYVQSAKLSFKFDYDVNQTLYEDNNSRDITTQMFGVTAKYKITPLVNFQLMYKYIYNIVNRNDFSGINYIRPTFNYMHKKFGLTSVHFLYSDTNNWVTRLRNTDTSGFGIAQYVFFSNYKRRVSLSYQYRDDDANGRNFDRDTHQIKLGLRTPLFFGINLDASGAYTQKEWDTRLAIDNRLREDNNQQYTVGLDKVLISKWGYLQNLVANGKYVYTYNRSNEDAVFTVNNHFEFGIRAAF